MKPENTHQSRIDWVLLFLRVSASLLLLVVHGLPKLLNLQTEMTKIEDPLGLGPVVTLSFAVFAEVLCPLLIALGLFTRLACLPILAVLGVSLALVHPEWSLADGQFAWLLAIIFVTLLIGGAGHLALGRNLRWQ
ncbi:DoxX family protein [Phytopseudomonas punonensis]|uniref:Putative oxidoreductase n=1 Tax=Phytopseudomonas punonensis TaxID=1220495 RepID=A0A1M7GBI1_9GAMM|nr:DoxX family protein [Pseudomonas punonensis]SHM13536.1 putative oxidoreductase [Pseudomonas punonensis]